MPATPAVPPPAAAPMPALAGPPAAFEAVELLAVIPDAPADVAELELAVEPAEELVDAAALAPLPAVTALGVAVEPAGAAALTPFAAGAESALLPATV